MKIIPIVNQGSGVGKTTVMMQLAAVLARRHKVLVVDVDPRPPTAWWANHVRDRLPFDFAGTRSPSMLARAREQGGDYDFVFVDTASGFEDTRTLGIVLDAADFVVVPLTPEPRTQDPTLRTIARLIEPRHLRHKVLLNRIDESDPRQLATCRRQLDTTFGIPRFEAYLRQQRPHAGTQVLGQLLTTGPETRRSARFVSDVTAFGQEMSEQFSLANIGVW